jgi:hypothetical protein
MFHGLACLWINRFPWYSHRKIQSQTINLTFFCKKLLKKALSSLALYKHIGCKIHAVLFQLVIMNAFASFILQHFLRGKHSRSPKDFVFISDALKIEPCFNIY